MCPPSFDNRHRRSPILLLHSRFFADLFHAACLDELCASLPDNTAPAGYACPTCKTPLIPPATSASPIADLLRKRLTEAKWAQHVMPRASDNLFAASQPPALPSSPSLQPSTASPPSSPTLGSAFPPLPPSDMSISTHVPPAAGAGGIGGQAQVHTSNLASAAGQGSVGLTSPTVRSGGGGLVDAPVSGIGSVGIANGGATGVADVAVTVGDGGPRRSRPARDGRDADDDKYGKTAGKSWASLSDYFPRRLPLRRLVTALVLLLLIYVVYRYVSADTVPTTPLAAVPVTKAKPGAPVGAQQAQEMAAKGGVGGRV
ncbi:Zinc finger protein-like 1 [Gonapodya sp. JEL0774]|nr:Zinc finger protein-like 1 [Gonapodya sp. JEL0774]